MADTAQVSSTASELPDDDLGLREWDGGQVSPAGAEKPDTRPVLVLIHGVAADHRVWDRVAPLLADRFRILTIDLPGVSLLRLDSSPLPLPVLAELVDQVTAARGITRYSLLAHSYGASVALLTAQRNVAHVEGVTAIAPGGFGPEINPVLRLMSSRTGASLLRISHTQAVRERVENAVVRYRRSGRSAGSVDELLEAYQRLGTRNARRYFRQSINAVLKSRSEASAGLLRPPGMPVQVLWGENDLVLPVWQARRAARVLDAQAMHVIPGAGHAPHRTHPELVAGFVLDFWRDHVVAANQLPLPFTADDDAVIPD